MKYGMRERISGAIILVALAVIFLPMLFDAPAPRGERPEPVLTIEQPIRVDQRDVEAPTPPDALGDATGDDEPSAPASETQLNTLDDTAPDATRSAPEEADGTASAGPQTAPVPAEEDPIAAIAQQSTASSEKSATRQSSSVDTQVDGDWAVQVGSFAQPDNADRLTKQLLAEGFNAYQRPRDNALTTVYVGPFASSEEGERVRTQLKKDVNIQGLLIRVQEE